MKTRWESFVFILLMLLPAVCLLNTGTRPVAPVARNSVSQPCSTITSSQTPTGGSEHGYAELLPHSSDTAAMSPGSSHQTTTARISK